MNEREGIRQLKRRIDLALYPFPFTHRNIARKALVVGKRSLGALVEVETKGLPHHSMPATVEQAVFWYAPLKAKNILESTQRCSKTC